MYDLTDLFCVSGTFTPSTKMANYPNCEIVLQPHDEDAKPSPRSPTAPIVAPLTGMVIY